MYKLNYNCFKNNTTTKELDVKELWKLLDNMKAHPKHVSFIKAFNTLTNETVRVHFGKYQTYFNKYADIWFDQDDFCKLDNNVPAVLRGFKVVYRSKNKYYQNYKMAKSPTGAYYRFEYKTKEFFEEPCKVYVKIDSTWKQIWERKGEYLENYYKAIKTHEDARIAEKAQKAANFEAYKQREIKKKGYYSYNPDQLKMFILNEIEEITTPFQMRNKDVIPARDEGQQIAMSLDTNTALQPAKIITSYHKFTQKLVDCHIEIARTTQKKTKTFIKESFALTLAQNLYNTGCPEIQLVDYRHYDEELEGRAVTITQADNLWDKLQEFCDLWSTKIAYNAESIAEEVAEQIKLETTPLTKMEKNFRKYASIYNLDANNPEHFETFKFLIAYPEYAGDFIDGSKFKCPHCGEIVYVNRHYIFSHGKYINTNQTICDNCGHEFNIHDKQDILTKIISKRKLGKCKVYNAKLHLAR